MSRAKPADLPPSSAKRGAPAIEGEAERLAELRAYRVLDTPPEASFDDFTLLAAQICDTPIALISLVDENRQWFKSKRGITTSETSRDDAFCAHTILRGDRVLEVKDARADPRFAGSILVNAEPHIRFYAGAPLVSPAGSALGALCVIDRKPRRLRPEQLEALAALSRQVVARLELRRHAELLIEEIAARERAEQELRLQNLKLTESQGQARSLLQIAEKSRGDLLSVLEDEQRAGHQLSRSNRALQMLSLCNEAVMMARDEKALLQEVCRIAVQVGEYRMAWVGYARNDPARRIEPVAQEGDTDGYLQEATLTWADEPPGQGPAGRCVREGVPIVCPDIKDPASGFLSVGAAERRGFKSVIALPLLEGGSAFGLVCLYSSESREVSEAEVRLLRDLASDLAFGIGALRNRLRRAETEAALVASLREKEALLREVHHRVKNNLQVITSLLRIEGRRIDHAVTKDVLGQMQSRIQSMALLHETLYRSGRFAQVDLAAYLGQLANQIFRSQAARPEAVALHLDLTQVQMAIDQAIPCGLIVNELASNCLKHGFRDGRAGEVWIRLRSREEPGEMVLSVSDNGAGLPEDFEERRGRSLGLQLVSDLARQLRGRLNIRSGPPAVFEVIFTLGHLPTVEIPPSKAAPTGIEQKEGP